MKIKMVIALCIFVLFFACCTSSAEKTGNITIMLYLCGNDLDNADELAATNDLLEIRDAIFGNTSVTVLVLAGGAKNWGSAICDPSETVLLEYGARGGPRTIQKYPAMNMGDPETLSFFLKYGVEHRPASQYALILWDHGLGPMGGVCIDALNNSDSLTLNDLQEALDDSPFSKDNHLSWIGFDACLMASVETAVCVKDYADYMVASQETEPTSGWNYSFLREIREHSSGLEICQNIVSGYMGGKKDTDMLTLSLIDLSKMDTLIKAINQFFEQINPILTEQSFSGFSRLRLGTKGFGRITTVSDYDLVDLYDFSEQFAQSSELDWERSASARSLQTALLLTVIKTSGNQPKAHGLSLYSPYHNKTMFSEKWKGIYQNWGFLTDYFDYVSQFSSFWTGKRLASWDRLTGRSLPLTEQVTQQIELTLTKEQTEHFASAYCLILEDDGSEYDYCSTYYIDDIQPEGTSLKAEYSFEALYAVDENGIVETESIPFEIRDGYYLIHAILWKTSYFNAKVGDEELHVTLVCKRNADELEILNVIPLCLDNDGLNLGRNTIDLDPEVWPYVVFRGVSRTKEIDITDSVLPFPEWYDFRMNSFNTDGVDREGNRLTFYEIYDQFGETVPSDIHSVCEADNSRPWKFKFMRRKATGKEMVAQFVIQDTQGNSWGSNLIPLTNPDVQSRADIHCDPIELFGCTLQPFEAKTIVSDSFQGVCIRIRFQGGSTSEANLMMANPIINNISSSRKLLLSSRDADEEEECIQDIYLDPDHMPFSDDPVIHTINCILTLPSHRQPKELFYDRIVMETDLDVSMLPLRERPREQISYQVEEEELEFRLIELHESEDTIISGKFHILNHSSVQKWIYINKLEDDTAPSIYINDLTLRNCVSIQEKTFILPGGEAYVDFEIYRNPGQAFFAHRSGEDEWHIDIDTINSLGFSVRLINPDDVIVTDDGLHYKKRTVEKDGKNYMIDAAFFYDYRFDLKTPLHLKTPIHIKYLP